jgi:hypothetical protein
MNRHGITVVVAWFIFSQALAFAEDARVLNAQLDLNGNGVLDETEVRLGVINRRSRLNLPALRNLPAPKREEAVKAILKAAEFQEEKSKASSDLAQLQTEYGLRGVAPPYALNRIDPKAFGLRAISVSGNTTAEDATKPQITRWSMAVRRTRDQTLKALRDPDSDVKPPSDDPTAEDYFPEGALFSYKQDRMNDFDTLNATGVFGLARRFGANPHYDASVTPSGSTLPAGVTVDNTRILRASEFFFMLSLDRSDNNKAIPKEDQSKPDSNPTEKDTLEFEIGFSNQYAWSQHIPEQETNPENLSPWGDNWLGLNYLGVDGALKLTTDSELRRRIWSGSLTFNPIWFAPGMEAYRKVGMYTNAFGKECSLAKYRYRLNLDLIGGTVEREGSNDFHRSYRHFAYAGGSTTLEIRPLPDLLDNRLTLLASYTWHKGISNNVDDADEFRASARYYFPMSFGFRRQLEAKGVDDRPWVEEPGQLLWALQLEYRRGETPITLEKERSLTLGIGVAF